MKIKWLNVWIAAFLAPTVLVLALFYIVPIGTVLVTGFMEWDGLRAPEFNGLDNYVHLITYDNTFFIALRNILLWSLIAATLHVGFGTLIAFVLYKKHIGWRFVRGVFMVPMVISAAAWAIIYKLFFNDEIGILNHMIRSIGFSDFHVNWFFDSPASFLAITLTWLFYAVYVTLIVYNDLMAIPKEVHEAALLDGANEWRIIRHINLPLVKKAIGTGIILSVTARIAGFEEVALTSRGGPGNDTYNITLMLYDGIVNYNYGYANAAATVMILLGILVLLLINRVFKMNESTY